jgi:hypothetical protein
MTTIGIDDIALKKELAGAKYFESFIKINYIKWSCVR